MGASLNSRIVSSQGSSFKCLPLLRELRIEAEADQGADMYDGVITADLTGLPAGLQTLKVAASTSLNLACCSTLRFDEHFAKKPDMQWLNAGHCPLENGQQPADIDRDLDLGFCGGHGRNSGRHPAARAAGGGAAPGRSHPGAAGGSFAWLMTGLSLTCNLLLRFVLVHCAHPDMMQPWSGTMAAVPMS